MSEMPDTPLEEKLVAVKYGKVAFLFDRSVLSGCAYFSPAPGPSRSTPFFAETLFHDGEQVPVFDLDGRLGRLFDFSEEPSFPLAVVISLERADQSILESLRLSCESAGSVWNGRYIACHLAREASVVPVPSNGWHSLPGSLGGVFRKRGFSDFCFMDDDAIGWRLDSFLFMGYSIDGASVK